MKNQKITFVITIVTLILASCNCNTSTEKIVNHKKKPTKESFIIANKSAVNEENEMIYNYIKRHGYTNVIRKDGVYIYNIKKSNNTIVNKKDFVQILYKVSLINGKIVEEKKTPQHIVVGKSGDIPMGVHYALEGMRLGEKAIIIVPSHLGYGVAGNKIIPPKSTLIYELTVLKGN